MNAYTVRTQDKSCKVFAKTEAEALAKAVLIAERLKLGIVLGVENKTKVFWKRTDK